MASDTKTLNYYNDLLKQIYSDKEMQKWARSVAYTVGTGWSWVDTEKPAEPEFNEHGEIAP